LPRTAAAAYLDWRGKRLKCVGSKKTGRFLALFPTSVIGSTQMVN
jgi:hypothetical protein